MNPPAPDDDDILPGFVVTILVIIIALFAVRNLPWHLDDDEQAKQAFVSYQMIEEGKWLVQDKPAGGVASKPPFQGWLSAAAYLGFGARGWELAWRLPAFVAALLILRALWRSGETLYGNNVGSLFAIGMFGLNSYVPRLATLVRTDMLLTAFIFFTGMLILEKLRTGKPWTRKEQIYTGLLLLGSTLTKGPIAYGFLLPGIVAFLFVTRKRSGPRHVWAGWIWWLLPMIIFGGWLAIGLQQPAFKEQVIDKEFLGRFTVGEGARHHNFPPGFYTLGLLGRTLPWTLLLILILCVKQVREAAKQDAVLTWLLCWTFGGLIFMECVPSKRFDRILPVVPPMCLLLAAAARQLPKYRLYQQPISRIAILVPLVAVPIAAGYAGWRIFTSFREDDRALVHFGQQAREAIGTQLDRAAVVNGKDEGMVMYVGVTGFTRLEDAMGMWRFKHIDWLVLGEKDFDKNQAALEPFDLVASTTTPQKSNNYKFLHRVNRETERGKPAPVKVEGTPFVPPIPAQPK